MWQKECGNFLAKLLEDRDCMERKIFHASRDSIIICWLLTIGEDCKDEHLSGERFSIEMPEIRES